MPFELLSWLRGQVGTYELPTCDAHVNDGVADDPREWLITNGLGSYASANIWGANTRRYHGLLVSSSEPPTQRRVLFSRIDETVSFQSEDNSYQLGTNFWEGGAVSPPGYTRVRKFAIYPCPTWMFELPDGLLIKQVIMPYLKQQVVIGYTWLTPDSPKGLGRSADLKLDLIVEGRDFHHETKKTAALEYEQRFAGSVVSLKPKGKKSQNRELFIHVDKGSYQVAPQWYLNYLWKREKERGLQATSDAFRSGAIEATLKPHETLTVVVSAEPFAEEPRQGINDYVHNEWTRRTTLLKKADFLAVPLEKILVMAADNFIVRRDSTRGATLMAGYHWFSDWGRDAMISLHGLTLSTGRFDEARSIIGTFAKYFSEGMLPNYFPESGSEPDYRSADVTFWWATSLFRYYQKTGDIHFVRAQLPFLESVIKAHDEGTRLGLKVDPRDALIELSDGSATWMDARVNGKAVTDRAGKCVEINALWYNFVKIVEILSIAAGGEIDDPESRGLAMSNRKAQKYGELADKIKIGFEKFWDESRGCLYDVLKSDGADSSIRPNQLFAASLPFPVVSQERTRRILEVVESELLTPYGLRSLAYSDSRFIGAYGQGKESATQEERDASYHQGTVWPWLIGAWADARLYAHGNDLQNRRFITRHLEPLLRHLSTSSCLGSISEIFDGDEPYSARGCVAQAWSVAELLRIVGEYRLLQDVAEQPELIKAWS